MTSATGAQATRRARRAAAATLALAAIAGCGSAASAPSGQSTKKHAYPVVFVNDTHTTVLVRGCPDCGSGYRLAPAARWSTGVDGGATEITYVDAQGARIGCAHMMNGALPAPGAPAQVLTVSAHGAC